jgi:hypothetical protein
LKIAENELQEQLGTKLTLVLPEYYDAWRLKINGFGKEHSLVLDLVKNGTRSVMPKV